MENRANTVAGADQFIDGRVWQDAYEAGFAFAEEVTYKNLSLDPGTLRERRQKFLDSGGENDPDFRPNHIDIGAVREHAAHLAVVSSTLPDSLADRAAWELLYGSYKGTDGSSKTNGYSRPAIYLQGSIDCWQHADLIPFGRRGKINIANSRHIAVMQAYDN